MDDSEAEDFHSAKPTGARFGGPPKAMKPTFVLASANMPQDQTSSNGADGGVQSTGPSNMSPREQPAANGGSSYKSQPCICVFVIFVLVLLATFEDLWTI